MVRLRALATGAASFIPGLYNTLYKASGGGGGLTQDPEYCYFTWLTHLAIGSKAGLKEVPQHVIELGPGLSLGSGICAVLSGVKSYHALDAIPYSNNQSNIELIPKLAALFVAKRGIPREREYPDITEALDSDGFPKILDVCELSYDIDALQKMSEEITEIGSGRFSYSAPWTETDVYPAASADFVFSKAVLEHVEDIQFTHNAIFHWLKRGGFAVHRIDFGSHGTSSEWNGHWAIGDGLWKIVRGKRAYSVNRNYLSQHIDAMKQAGFEIVLVQPQVNTQGINRSQLSDTFKEIDHNSFTARQAFVVGKKK